MAGVTREAKAAADPFLDRVGLGLLTHSFPPDLVDEVIEQAGVREQRRRALPARLMVYFTLALWLYVRCGYGLVMDKLTVGLAWCGLSDQDVAVPRTGSITKARQRLGPEVMRLLFDRVAGPIGAVGAPGVWWRGWRVCSLDGTTLAVPDSPDNRAAFAKPSNQHDAGSYPLARVVVLAENGTKAVIDAAIDGYQVDERSVAARVIPAMRADMLVLGDRGFPGYELWAQAAATGAALVWRLPAASFNLPVLQVLPDGSYLSRLRGPYRTGRPRPPDIPVRVIEYAVITREATHPGGAGQDTGEVSELFVLITTLTDPDTAPAAELAELYRARWEAETALGALKTTQRGGHDAVLRSRDPAGVRQEFWAMLCVYNALREVICQAASAAGADPARISFKRTLEAARDSAQRDFSP